jgi:O-antigen/teichoic acid export membrane protein
LDLQNLATGSALAFGGALAGNGLTYLFGVMMGRLLGADAVGHYFLALVLMQLAGTFCRLGFADALLRFVAIDAAAGRGSRVKGTVRFTLTVAVVVSIAMSAVLFALADPVSEQLFRQPALSAYLRWMAVTLPFFTVFVLSLNVTQALRRMDLVVMARDLAQPAAMIAAAAILFLTWRSASGFLAGHLLSMALGCGVSLYFLARLLTVVPASAAGAFGEWKVLLAFSLPVAGSDVINFLFRWSDTLVVSFLGSASDVGIYNAALRTTLLLNLLAVAVTALYAPMIANHYDQGRYQSIEIILKTLIRWCLILALPIVLTLGLLGDRVLLLWGPSFAAGSTAIAVLAVSQMLLITSGLLAFTLVMCGRQYLELTNVVVVTVVNVGLNLVFVPRYGINGAALAMLCSQTVILLARLVEVRRSLGLRICTAGYVKPLLAVAPAYVVGAVLLVIADRTDFALLASNFGVMATVVAAVGAMYLAGLYLLGPEKEDMLLWGQLRATASASATAAGPLG